VTAEQITMLATAFNNLRVGALLAGTIVPIVNGQAGAVRAQNPTHRTHGLR
jgi:hypothetical protein